VRTVVVAADLPNMTVEDLLPMKVRSGIAIAPDESGLGTNALSLPSPTAISFQYGYGSFNAHCKEARTKRYPLKIICRPGLAFDLDTKDDLTRLKGWP
ncbi:MAG: 2-phospho-L-lactate guanylyltransferase, partial [Pseudomonadota bacterium]|nr:2-phospho-L-lactate guanylyltransferase [Pseudomonadota bacterium]